MQLFLISLLAGHVVAATALPASEGFEDCMVERAALQHWYEQGLDAGFTQAPMQFVCQFLPVEVARPDQEL
jgi:hypothetical protein